MPSVSRVTCQTLIHLCNLLTHNATYKLNFKCTNARFCTLLMMASKPETAVQGCTFRFCHHMICMISILYTLALFPGRLWGEKNGLVWIVGACTKYLMIRGISDLHVYSQDFLHYTSCALLYIVMKVPFPQFGKLVYLISKDVLALRKVHNVS